MAPLTWRDTTAPNFYTSVDAQRLAGQSLNNAFSGASDALGKFHDWQQGQAGTALANNLAQYPDAASENAARANGTLFDGVDRANLTPQALGTVNSNASTLLANAADAARLPSVGPQAAASVQATQASTGLTQASTAQTNQSTNITGRNYTDTQAGADAAHAIIAQAGGDVDVGMAALNQQRATLTPGAFAQAESMIRGSSQPAPGGSGPTGPGSVPGALSAAAPPVLSSDESTAFKQSIKNPGVAKYVSDVEPNLPDMSGMTTNAQKAAAMMPVIMKYGEKTGGSMTDAKGNIITSPTGAIGAAQVEPPTFADMKKAHPDITGSITDPASNIKAGQYYLQAMLDRYNGDPLKAVAAYNAGQVPVDKWSTAATANQSQNVISSHNAAQIDMGKAADALKLSASKLTNQGGLPNYTTLQQDTTPFATLMQNNKGAKDNQFSAVGDDLMTQAKDKLAAAAAKAGVPDLSDATSMALLQKYFSFQKAGLFTPNSFIYSPGRDGISLDNSKGLDQTLAMMKNPDQMADLDARTKGMAGLAAAGTQAAQTDSDNLAAWKAAHYKKQTNPELDTTKVDRDLVASQANLARMRQAIKTQLSPPPAAATLPATSPRARPGPPIPAAPATSALNTAATLQPTQSPATAALAAAIRQQNP